MPHRVKIKRIYLYQLYRPDVVVALQTIKLRDWFHVAHTCLGDVPDFDTTFTAGVNILGRIRDCYRADYFAVIQGINLTRMTWYTWTTESVLRERRRLHMTVEHMVAIRAAKQFRLVTITMSLLSSLPSVIYRLRRKLFILNLETYI